MHQPLLIIFGRNVTKRVSSQWFTFPSHLTNALVLLNCLVKYPESQKSHRFSHMLYYYLARIQPVAAWFFSSVDLQLILSLLHDSLNDVTEFSFGLLGGALAQEEMKLRVLIIFLVQIVTWSSDATTTHGRLVRSIQTAALQFWWSCLNHFPLCSRKVLWIILSLFHCSFKI